MTFKGSFLILLSSLFFVTSFVAVTAQSQGADVSSSARDVDPLLGFEIETLRRQLNDASARIVSLEERIQEMEQLLDAFGIKRE